jgi:hypothetical protein
VDSRLQPFAAPEVDDAVAREVIAAMSRLLDVVRYDPVTLHVIDSHLSTLGEHPTTWSENRHAADDGIRDMLGVPRFADRRPRYVASGVV